MYGIRKDMKHKAFTEIVAGSTQVPEKTVAVYIRFLKAAGLLTSGARGVNAPEMTTRDLARILIALCSTDRPSDAVEAVNWYRELHCTEGCTITMGKVKDGIVTDERIDLFTVDAGDSLEAIMEGVFGAPPIITTRLGMHFEIIEPNRVAILTLGDSVLRFTNPEYLEERGKDGGLSRGLKTARSLTDHALKEMAIPFGLEQSEGATWEEITADEERAAKVAARHIFGVKDKGNADE